MFIMSLLDPDDFVEREERFFPPLRADDDRFAVVDFFAAPARLVPPALRLDEAFFAPVFLAALLVAPAFEAVDLRVVFLAVDFFAPPAVDFFAAPPAAFLVVLLRAVDLRAVADFFAVVDFFAVLVLLRAVAALRVPVARLVAVFFAPVFLAVVAFLAVPVDFLAVVFLAVAFLAVPAFLAVVFFAALLVAPAFDVLAFLVVFLPVDFLAPAALRVVFLAAFFGPDDIVPSEGAAAGEVNLLFFAAFRFFGFFATIFVPPSRTAARARSSYLLWSNDQRAC